MPTPNHYVVYARKSSESEDRQVLSIDAQVQELKTLAQKRGIKITEILTEAQSAKSPGRQVFTQLDKQISKGEVTGILCWKLDRLARNPVDGGSIIWAMKQHGLQIYTPTQSYSTAEDNIIMMYIEFGMAQKYIDDLSQNVKRGNRMKLENGGYPGLAPHGYCNDVVNHTIIPDPDRFSQVRRMWNLMLTGTYTVPQIVRIANEKWSYRTRKYKRIGGCKLHASVLYKAFSNPFYYGLIKRTVDGKQEVYPGIHKPMITENEFQKVQQFLGRNNQPRRQKHSFNYTGLMSCGECNASITAEEHTKPSGRHYIYYRCTKKRGACSQPFTPQSKLEEQVQTILHQITVSDDFRDWALKHLKEANSQEIAARTNMYQSQQAAYNSCQKQLDNLVSMNLRELISEEEYIQKREELQRELGSLKLKLDDTEDRAAKWLELTETALYFANLAQKIFNKGTNQQKREIVHALGSNFILKDKTITLNLQKPFTLLQNANAKSQQSGQSPRSFASGRAKATTFEPLLDQISSFFRQKSNQALYIPKLAP